MSFIYRGSGIQSSRGYFAYYISLFCFMKIKYTQRSLFDMRHNRLVVDSIKKSKLSYLTLKLKYDLLLLLAMGPQSRYRPIAQYHIYSKSAEE